jgi:hypothetical protein
MYPVPVGIIGRGHIGRGELRTATSNSTRCNPGGVCLEGDVEGGEWRGRRGSGGVGAGTDDKRHITACAR